MNQTPYASIIAVLLCGAMTAPLWLDRLQPTAPPTTTATVAETTPAPPAEPTPSLSPAPTATAPADANTRLACGVGIISRLRNRGERCVEVPQPYAYPYAQPSPAYEYTQPCVPAPCVPAQPVYPVPVCPAPAQPIYTQPAPAQPIYTQPVPTQTIPTQPIPQQTIPTQPMVTQPAPSQPTVPYVESAGQLRDDCNCQECCQEFQLTRWRVVPVEKEVTEDYVDCVVETSTFCDSSCEQGDCLETIGIQNRKSHVVMQKPRVFTVTELRQETVIEKRCVKCGCIKETRLVPGSTYSPPAYGTQKPVVEDDADEPASESRKPARTANSTASIQPTELEQSALDARLAEFADSSAATARPRPTMRPDGPCPSPSIPQAPNPKWPEWPPACPPTSARLLDEARRHYIQADKRDIRREKSTNDHFCGNFPSCAGVGGFNAFK